MTSRFHITFFDQFARWRHREGANFAVSDCIVFTLLLRCPTVGRCAKYCGHRVCMSVCLSLRSYIFIIATSEFHQTFCTCYTCSCEVLLWRQCHTLCTSGFVDDVMCSHNGANRPESITTHILLSVRQVAALGRSLFILPVASGKIKIIKALMDVVFITCWYTFIFIHSFIQ